MRILIINSEYPPIGGGAGNASANLARQLAALGQDVTVLTARFGDLPVEEQQDGVRLMRVCAMRRRQERSNAVEQIAFMVVSTLKTLALLRSWRPDVILAFFGIPSGLAGWAARRLAGVPYLVSLRGGDVPGFRPYDFALYHRLAAPLIRMIWREAAHVVANSAGLKALAQTFDPATEISVIPNGVDLERYQPASRAWDPPHLLLVGRLVHQKGVDLLLEALAGLEERPWALTLVGDGPQRPELQAFVETHRLQERVRFASWLDGDDLVRAYQQANLFVFPSRHEGMPNAVLEAMAAGLPVVASRIAGNEELVVDGETGLLVPPEAPDALRAALRPLLEDAALRRSMGAAGRARVEEHFSWRRAAEAYLHLMFSVPRPPSPI